MTLLQRLHHLLTKVEMTAIAVVWGGLIFLTLLVTANVVARYFFQSPIPGAVNMTELLMPHIVFAGLAYTLMQGGQVQVTLVLDRLSPGWRRRFQALASALGLLLFAALTYKSSQFFWDSFVIRERMLAPIYLPWWLGKLAMPIGCALMSLRYLVMMLQALLEPPAAQDVQLPPM